MFAQPDQYVNTPINIIGYKDNLTCVHFIAQLSVFFSQQTNNPYTVTTTTTTTTTTQCPTVKCTTANVGKLGCTAEVSVLILTV